jgi:diguanylate cyclase (GGDEF)-like protein
MAFWTSSLHNGHAQPRAPQNMAATELAGILAARFNVTEPIPELVERNPDDEMRRLVQWYGERYDPQTKLLNHQAFQTALNTLVHERPAGQEIALLWIDVLNLRREFGLWGSKGVDALVVHIADKLRSAVDRGAIVGRFGARCFLVALPASKFDRADRNRIQRIVDALEPMRVAGTQIRPEVAAGVAFFPTDADFSEDLVRFASLAASRANGTKNCTVMTFDTAMNSLLMRDYQLEMEIRKGLDEDQFRMHYQPKVDLQTGKITGAEALIRWNHPEWGPVPQSEFIPLAERSNLIQRIFEFGMRTALKDAQRWRDAGVPLPIISVNTSQANLRHEDFARIVRDIQAEIPVAPTRLELEVTESMLLEDESLIRERLQQVKDAGAHIAIDDFGTRYTGFNMLRQLPLYAMKIDHCFIHGIDHSQEMRALCRTIVAMARDLKLRTVAEGIETVGELRVAREIGCDEGQGYLFQRPIPAEEFGTFLKEWPERQQEFGYPGVREVTSCLIQYRHSTAA